MTYKAYIFARPGGAIILGEAYGGLALGFQIDDENTTLVGGFELAGGNAAHVSDAMDFWFALTDNPLRFMSALLPYGRGTRYDMAKILQVDDPQVEAAQTVIERIKATGRNLRSQDWLKDTVEVLEAFGVKGLPGGARQSGVFGGINAPIVPLVEPWPGMALDVSLYEQPDQFGIRTDPNADANENASDPAADQGQDSLDGPRPQPVISSILVRKGHLAVYSNQGFDGTPIVLELGKVFNVKDVKDAVWPDKTVRSWFASASSFDAAMPKTAYASRQRVDFRKLELDARDALRNIAEYREGAIKEQRSFQEESQKILESMRAAAAEAGVSQQAVYFKEEANYQAAAAVKWLVAAGLIAAGTVALALSSIGWFVKGSTGLSPGDAIQLAVAKLIAFSVLYYALFIAGRSYLAARHNFVVNRHRQNALSTFQAFVNATADEATKNAVLLKSTEAIFSPDVSGYLAKEPDPRGASQILEIFRGGKPDS